MAEETSFSPKNEASTRTITLERPSKANSLTADVVEQLLAHVAEAGSDDTRVLVFRGTGKNFCAGFDLSDYAEQSEGDLLRRFLRLEALLQAIRYAPLVTVCCVHGAALGAGADIAAACAYRLGTPGSRFRFPGFQFGVALGTRHLARVVGTTRARTILLNNELLDAAAAHACGLLTHVVEEAAFEQTVKLIAEGVQHLSQAAMRQILWNTTDDTRDRDLAELARSVSAPGLHKRIEQYRSRSAAP